MSFKVVAGKLDLLPSSIVCQLHNGETGVVCIVSRQVLRDLRDFYRLRGSDEAVFSEMLPELERMATIKLDNGTLDKDGHVRIGTADLLRYGACH